MIRRFMSLLAAAALSVACLSARAGMISTPKVPDDGLEKALREAFPGPLDRYNELLGMDHAHAAGLSPFLIQLIIYGGIVAIVMLVGVIAIIGYGLSKKNKDDDRFMPR
ncbi:MAG: hypothetical protein K8T20_08375 [Planctomycetes bacterium]|nr:hypothetical protein [Planctomycetota bacterium]